MSDLEAQKQSNFSNPRDSIDCPSPRYFKNFGNDEYRPKLERQLETYPTVQLAKRSRLVYVTVFFALLLIIVTGLNALREHDVNSRRYLFTFGDSYTSTGFDINGQQPTFENPFGNPPFPGPTDANEHNWIGTVVHDLSPPRTLSYNFANGGACVDARFIPSAETIFNFVNTTKLFKDSLAHDKSHVRWTSTNSAFVFWYGTNDIMRTFNEAAVSIDMLYENILDSYFEQVEKLYYIGGRRFVFMSVHDLERTPYFQSFHEQSEQALVHRAVGLWNHILQDRAATFSAKHPESHVNVMDTRRAIGDIINYPEVYGAPNATCYNNDAVSCLWWDPLHPGKHMHAALARKAHDALKMVGFY